MKRRKQTLLAVAAAIGLLGGIQSLSYGQAQGKQASPASGGQRSGDAAGPRGGDGGNTAPPKRSDGSPDDRRGNDGGDRGNDGSGARSPGRTAPNPTPPTRTPAAPARTPGQAGPNESSPRPGENTAPRGRAPWGTARERAAEHPNAPAQRMAERQRQQQQRRQQMKEQLAQRPIILAPWWYRANTWPWWYESYFPTFGYYGNGIDDYSGWDDDIGDDARTAGWQDDRYDERRRDRSAEGPATTTTPPANPAAGQGAAAAALNADPAYRQALADVARLQSRYDEASRKVLGRLKEDNAEYRRLLEFRDRAEDRVDAAQAASAAGTDPAKVAPAAQRKLEINTRITQLEQEAIRQDPEASAARKALEEANARVAAMRQAAGAGVPTTPITPAPVNPPVNR